MTSQEGLSQVSDVPTHAMSLLVAFHWKMGAPPCMGDCLYS